MGENYRRPAEKYEGHRLSQAERRGAGRDEPDVLLDVPVLKVEEITLKVEGLRLHVSVLADWSTS